MIRRQNTSTQPNNTTPNPNQPTSAPWQNHPAYRQWIREFFQALFDFEFQQSVTVKMLPLLYAVGILASAFLALYCITQAFTSSIWQGLGFLVLLGPLIFVFCTAALRSTLEFFSAVFRIQHNMGQLLSAMGGMRQELSSMQKDMSELTKAVEVVAEEASDIASTVHEAKAVIGELEGITDRIPFFRKPKKTERQKNWAEAPLAEQYDLTDTRRKPQAERSTGSHSDNKTSDLPYDTDTNAINIVDLPTMEKTTADKRSRNHTPKPASTLTSKRRQDRNTQNTRERSTKSRSNSTASSREENTTLSPRSANSTPQETRKKRTEHSE